MFSKNCLYKDINLSFEKNPYTGDIITLADEEAIKRSLRNLILTDLLEVPFIPDLGSSIRGSLFENFTPFTVEFLKKKIYELIEKYEPRIQVQKVIIYEKNDLSVLEVSIVYKIIGFKELYNVSVFVERTR